MEIKKKQKGVDYTSPIGVASYPALLKPAKKFQSEEKEYTVIILFKKGEDLKSFKLLCDQSLSEFYGKDKSKWPANIIYPFVDQGIEKKDLELKGKNHAHLTEGAVKVRFKTKEEFGAPPVLDRNSQEIIDSTQIYGGCLMRVRCNIKVNPAAGTKKTYVTPYLVAAQVMGEGTPLGGVGKIPHDQLFEPIVFDDDELEDNVLG